MKDINAKGSIVPEEPLDIEEGDDIRLTLDAIEANVQPEDAALARAIAEGLTTRPVSKRRVLAVVRNRWRRGGRLGV